MNAEERIKQVIHDVVAYLESEKFKREMATVNPVDVITRLRQGLEAAENEIEFYNDRQALAKKVKAFVKAYLKNRVWNYTMDMVDHFKIDMQEAWQFQEFDKYYETGFAWNCARDEFERIVGRYRDKLDRELKESVKRFRDQEGGKTDE